MAEYLILGETLNALADTVREKFGINKDLKISEIIDTINDFSGSSTETKKKGINFYDYDGTLLYTYTVEEFASATNLPPLPTLEGLICQGWNWSLEDIKAMGREVDIGATYITDDGNTRLYIHLEEGYTSPMLGMGVNGTVTIDWGDGSEPDILTGSSIYSIKYTSNHEYGAAGDYIITLTVGGANEQVSFLGDSYSGTNILKHSFSMDTLNIKYHSFLLKVEIGNNIIINSYAFLNCYNLTSITIPNSVTSIGVYAFKNCYNLTSIIIPDSVTSIGNYVFLHCYNLTSITIPNTVKNIGNNAFLNCYNLTSITISNSVISIGGYAFLYCYNLTSIIIPNSVTSISDDIFSCCYNLTSIIIPNSVISIGGYAFLSCYNLTSIIIPNSVTSIGNYTFLSCYNLTSITIPDSVTSIGTSVFLHCYNLTSITISNSITNIGNYVFSNCNNLISIIIPDSVKSIGTNVFAYCYNMCFYDFTSHTAIPTLSATNAFTGIQPGCEIRVPIALYDEWIQATNWTSYRDYIIGV